jgi:hypothetical protein
MRALNEVARLSLLPLLPVAAVLISACGNQAGEPSDVTGPADPVDSPIVVELEAITVDDPLYAVLYQALQDELQAETSYALALGELGADVKPFSRIVLAEGRHVDAVSHLFTKRGIDPVPEYDPGAYPPPDFTDLDLAEACAIGLQAEFDNVAMYDALLAGGDLPADVASVFSTLRAASLLNHAPAFDRCD